MQDLKKKPKKKKKKSKRHKKFGSDLDEKMLPANDSEEALTPRYPKKVSKTPKSTRSSSRKSRGRGRSRSSDDSPSMRSRSCKKSRSKSRRRIAVGDTLSPVRVPSTKRQLV